MGAIRSARRVFALFVLHYDGQRELHAILRPEEVKYHRKSHAHTVLGRYEYISVWIPDNLEEIVLKDKEKNHGK